MPPVNRRLRIRRSADSQELKKGATVERAKHSQKDCHKLGLPFTRLHPRPPGRNARNHPPHHHLRKNSTSKPSKSPSHTPTRHRTSTIFASRMASWSATTKWSTRRPPNGPNPIPGPPADDLMEAVHHFYDEYTSAPKRRSESYTKPPGPAPTAMRLYHEAKSFLKLRANATMGSRQRAATTPSPETVSGVDRSINCSETSSRNYSCHPDRSIGFARRANAEWRDCFSRRPCHNAGVPHSSPPLA